MKIHLSTEKTRRRQGLPKASLACITALGLLVALWGHVVQAQLGIQGFSLFPGAEDSFMGRSNAVGDFNNDGYDDLAVGLPTARINGNSAAGAAVVFYGGPGTWQSFEVITADQVGSLLEVGANFGFSLTTGDFDNDGRDDLVIGSPGRTISGAGSAGEIIVIYGSPSTLDLGTARRFSQVPLPGAPQEADRFGYSLAAGDLSADGIDDLAIGVPFEDTQGPLGLREDVGAISILYGVAGVGLDAEDGQLINQNTAGVGLNANAGELFGFSLAIGQFVHNAHTDLAVGTPAEAVFGSGFQGAVILFPGAPGGIDTVAGTEVVFSQMTDGVLGTLGDGDQFGFSLAAGNFDGDLWTDLAIGVPGETEFGTTQSGAVQVLYGGAIGLTAFGDQFLVESTIDNAVDEFDQLGFSVAAGDFNADGRDDLVMGAPLDDSLGIVNAGEITVLYGTPSGVSFDGHQVFNLIFFDTLESDVLFGTALAAGHFFNRSPAQDLAVGIPLYGSSSPLPPGASLIIRTKSIFSDGFESGDVSQWSLSVP